MSCEKNKFVDALATLASMTQINIEDMIQLVSIEVRSIQTHSCTLKKSLDRKPQYNDIKWFIQHREHPLEASKNDEKTLKMMAMNNLDGKILYKRLFDWVLLRFFSRKEAEQVL
jgi:hypothetical protein